MVKIISNEKTNNILRLTIALVLATMFIVGFNAYQLNSVLSMNGMGSGASASSGDGEQGMSSSMAMAGPDVIPKGISALYENELGVSFDDVSASNSRKADATIQKLGKLDEKLTLTGADLERYIAITSKISCEYCCGVPSIIVTKEDIEKLEQQIQAAIAAGKITQKDAERYRQQRKMGDASCGCAHSFAMRGLAKYLIKNHSGEYTNDQILEELGKWKTLFFPGKMTQKAAVLKERGIELNYINLASNKYRGIENQRQASSAQASTTNTQGSMVGGC